MEDIKVKIRGKKEILTLTGESFVVDGMTYYEVKKREFFIPENILIKVK